MNIDSSAPLPLAGVRDFEGLDVEVVNPWEPLPPTTSR